MTSLPKLYESVRAVVMEHLRDGLSAALSAGATQACSTEPLVGCKERVQALSTLVAPTLVFPKDPSVQYIAKTSSPSHEDALLKVEETLVAFIGKTFDAMKQVGEAAGLPPLTDEILGRRLSPMLPLVPFADGDLKTWIAPDFYEMWIADSKGKSAKETDAAFEDTLHQADLWASIYAPTARDVVLADLVSLGIAAAALDVPADTAPVVKKSSMVGWLIAAGAAAVALAKAKAFG